MKSEIPGSKPGLQEGELLPDGTLFERTYENPNVSEPKVMADAILKAITARNPNSRHVTGYMAKTHPFFKRVLPETMYDRLLSASLKVIIGMTS